MKPERESELRKLHHYFNLREQVSKRLGSLSKEEIDLMRQRFTLSISNDALNSDRSKIASQELDNDLKAINDWYKTQRITASVPRITATYLTSQHLRTMEKVAISHPQPMPRQNLMFFAAINDFCLGANFTASSILQAEDWIRGTQEQKVADRLDTLPLNPAEDAQAFLYVRNMAMQNASLLEKDPTGTLLIEQTVRYIKENQHNLPMMPNYIISSFFIDGAEYAKNTYNIVYPVAQKLKDTNQFT